MFEVQEDKRRHPRFNLRLPVQYKNIKDLTSPLAGALTSDISEGGIRFIGNDFLSLANRLVLNIALPAPSHSIKIISKVAWIRKVPMGDQYEIGNQFLNMSQDDKEELKGYIEKLPVVHA